LGGDSFSIKKLLLTSFHVMWCLHDAHHSYSLAGECQWCLDHTRLATRDLGFPSPSFVANRGWGAVGLIFHFFGCAPR
jgi:hypothetical protein